MQQYFDDTPEESAKVYKEFDYPSCDANNPWEDGFSVGSEVRCHYCGIEYRLNEATGRKLKFKEI
jgi:hypothetical protein